MNDTNPAVVLCLGVFTFVFYCLTFVITFVFSMSGDPKVLFLFIPTLIVLKLFLGASYFALNKSKKFIANGCLVSTGSLCVIILMHFFVSKYYNHQINLVFSYICGLLMVVYAILYHELKRKWA